MDTTKHNGFNPIAQMAYHARKRDEILALVPAITDNGQNSLVDRQLALLEAATAHQLAIKAWWEADNDRQHSLVEYAQARGVEADRLTNRL